VFGRGDAILAAPFDLNRLEVTGAPVTLVEHVATSPRDGVGSFQLSKSGVLVYSPQRSRAGRVLTWVDRAGVETPLPMTPRAFSTPRVSPDGKTIAFAADDADRRDIWTYNIAADQLTRVTSEGGENGSPLWTPDGQWLTYVSNRGGTHHLIRQRVDGTGAAESLLTSRNILLPGAWTSDTRTLLYMDWPPTDKFQMLALHLDRDRHSEPLGPRGFPSVSPDGRWVAFMSRPERGRSEVYVETLPPSGSPHQVTVDGGSKPLWSRNGRELFYQWGGSVFRVAVDTSHGFSTGKAARLFDNKYVVSPDGDYDVAPDGRFLMIKPGDDERAPGRLNVVVDWVDELARRVPTGK
jgi:Tol biopolymer transport system component